MQAYFKIAPGKKFYGPLEFLIMEIATFYNIQLVWIFIFEHFESFYLILDM